MYQSMCTSSTTLRTRKSGNPCMCGFLDSAQPAKVDLVSISGGEIRCVDGFVETSDYRYPCANVNLLARVGLRELNSANGKPRHKANDIWGWTAPTGEEIAIIGLTSGTAFVDISDPVNYRYLGKLPGHARNSIWRDMKTYNNHVFIVSDTRDHGMQVSLSFMGLL